MTVGNRSPVVSLLDACHRPPARYLAAAPYRRRYDERFLSAIHAEDDLLHYGFPLATGHPATHYHQAAQMYFAGGDWNTNDVERVLSEVGHPLVDAHSVLEFASGYGRLTRHLVQRLSPSRITVSDIDPRAVEFLTRRLGVDGFTSATTPEALAHDGRYDLIVVVSLFSHLPHDTWGRWLRRLGELLAPGGVLLFTTHSFGDADPRDFERPADGLLYRRENETRGRLDPAHYGATFVTEQYVAQAVAENISGRLIRMVPHALLVAQDAYVVQRLGES